MLFIKSIHISVRLIHILAIIIKRGILYIGLRNGIIPVAKDNKKFRKYGINTAQFVRVTIEQLGPTFVKFGQFLSVRPDLVSDEVRCEFRNLQDNVPPFPVAKVREILDAEFKVEHTGFFSELSEAPVASASISQVHRARLQSGEDVAVKVQRPGIRKKMHADITIMAFMAFLTERLVPRLRKNRPRMLVVEFSKWTENELDFRKEARNAAHFHYHFQGYEGVKFPLVYLDHTTEKVVVTEFINGKNLLYVSPEEIDNHAVVRRLTESMLKQIFIDGYFHGDPHPGNIFLLSKDTIAYLDFGIVGHLRKELREWSFDVLYGMAEGDIERVIDSFIELCDVNEEEVDVQAYRRRVNEVLGGLHVCHICGISFSSVLQEFLNASLAFGLNVPDDVVIMSKAIATLEGTCQAFAPEIKIIDFMKPYAQKFIITEPNLESVVEKIMKGPYETGRWGRLASKRFSKVLHRLEQGSIRLESDEFNNIVIEMDKSSANISHGLIISALIIFAAVISDDTVFEQWLRSMINLPNIPILPITSLALAGFVSLRLYYKNHINGNRS